MQKLLEPEVLEIKKAIWSGQPHTIIARTFGLSQPHVSRIAKGEQWAEVPWPDGSIGAIAPERLRSILYSRRKSHAGIYIKPGVEPITEDQSITLSIAEKVTESIDETVLRDALIPTKNKPKKIKKKALVSVELIPLDELERRAGHLPYVRKAFDEKDKAAIFSIQAVLSQVSETAWDTVQTVQLVHSTLDLMKGERK